MLIRRFNWTKNQQMFLYIFTLLLFQLGCISSQEFLAAPPPGLRTNGEVWPLPQQISYGRKSRVVGKNSIEILYSASKPLEKWLFPEKDVSNDESTNGIFSLKIKVNKGCIDNDEYPQQEMIEEYWLNVPEKGDATLEATEVWGIVRGLETFSQLIYRVNDTVSLLLILQIIN
uniref:Beta-hexosaminidase eukaryotic type N-terminal domain-containing protein n=1 Tax=Acrobeloides nanus TaxID=290746 RepID=A0A914D9I8_9BILA